MRQDIPHISLSDIARVAELADARDLKSVRGQFSTDEPLRASPSSTAKKTSVYAAFVRFLSRASQARPSSYAHKKEKRTDTTTDTSFRRASLAGKPSPLAGAGELPYAAPLR